MKKLSLALCAVVASLPLSAQVAARPAVPATLSGSVNILWEDNFKAHTTRPRTFVFDSRTRQSYEVQLDSLTVKALGGVARLRGARLQMNATPDGRATSVQRIGRQTFPTTRPGTPMWTTRRVLVVLCRPSDGLTPYGSVDDFKELWFGSGPLSVASFWKEASNGQMTITGDVLDWHTMSGKSADYLDKTGALDLHKFMPECDNSIPANIDVTTYDVIAHDLGMGLPVELGGFADTTTVRGVLLKNVGTTITGWKSHPQDDLGPHAHEMGHALSLFHTGPLDANTYTSDWDVMSNATLTVVGNTFVAAEPMIGQKDLLGLVPVARRFVATGVSNTITLERAALPANNSNYLMATIPITFNDSVGQYNYTVELRQKAGFDAYLPIEGVVIHEQCPCTADQTFVVLDRDGNFDVNDRGAALQAGDTWEDRANQISVTVESITGTSARVTIRNGRGKVLTLPASGGRKSIVEGTTVTDSIAVNASGPFPAQPWTASNASANSQWMTVLTPTGGGSGWVRIQRNGASLAPGTYYDTLKVALATDNNSYRLYYDTLVVTAGSATHVGLSLTARVDSNFAGIGHIDTALVRISGPNAATATWTARRKKSWSFIGADGLTQTPTATGTGNGVVRFSSLTSSTTPTGWYVDTITVKLDASPDSAVIYDSILVVPPVQYTLSTHGRRDSIAVGGLNNLSINRGQVAVSKLDSVSIAFSGLWSTRAAWKVTPGNKPLRFLVPVENGIFANTQVGQGNGTAYFRRVALDSTKQISLKPGTYIDTLFVIGPYPTGNVRVPTSQPQQLIIDTLVVYAAPAPAGLALSSKARVDTIALGMNASIDSVLVVPGGPTPEAVQWAATVILGPAGQLTAVNGPVSPFNVFLNPKTSLGYGAIGAGWLRYQRNVDGKGPGTYVNTLPIATLDGSFTVNLIDTLVILPAASLSMSQAGHADTVAAGTRTIADSVSVFALGANASSLAWSASKRRSFTTIATPAGTGSGMLRWTHDVSSLAAGLYVDTITVTAPNARGTKILDSIFVKGGGVSTQIAAAKFDADSVGGVLNYQFSTTLQVNTAPINQSLASYAALVDWDSTVVQLDSARGVTNGFPAPTVNQTNKGHVSLTATSGAGQSGNVSLARLYFHFSASNIGKVTSITPSFTSAKSPSGTELVSFLIQSSTKAQIIPGAFRGDVNVDGVLTSADALILLRALVGFPGTGATLTPNGDANCDGKTGAVDVQYILAKLVGLPVGTACVGTIR